MAKGIKTSKRPRKAKLVATDPRNPAPSSEAVRRSMQGNRGKDTGPELLLRKSLWAVGVRGYRLHRRIEGVRPDLVFGKVKVAVFVQGCFWHRCPICRPRLPLRNRAFWMGKFSKNKSRDRRNQRVLRSAGWRVVVLWECQLTDTRVVKVATRIDYLTSSKIPRPHTRS